ncbi:MAG: hypothetical protein AAFY41_01780 [Bacteroidota bacterium]
MKTRNSIIASLWILIALFMWSCSEDSETPLNPDQESIVADNLLVNSNSAINRMRSTGIGGPMGALFGNFQQSSNGRSNTSPSALFRNHGRIESDTVVTDSTDTRPKCLVETWEDDGNGNYTYTLDFGDGCDYYGEFLKGKLVEKGSYNENSFTSIATYTNFGGHDWMVDGTHSYSGTWDEINSTSEPADTSYYEYNATYEFSADLKTSYMEYGHDTTSEVSTGERLIEVDYVAEGSEEVDQNGYTIKSRSESVEINTGESFQAQVDIPIYFDFNCEGDVWIFVSGKESGSYTVGDETGTYSIDYGNGKCDNIVTVTENGVSEEVDLGEEWDDWEEECGNEG